MNPEKLVCSSELSKALCNLGIRMETCFYWVTPEQGNPYLVSDIYTNIQFVGMMCFPAPTASEIGERLPGCIINSKGLRKSLSIWKSESFWITDYGDCEIYKEHASLAEAMGLMLKYLAENNLVERR